VHVSCFHGLPPADQLSLLRPTQILRQWGSVVIADHAIASASKASHPHEVVSGRREGARAIRGAELSDHLTR
jgi:hypothetical protein